MLDFSQLVPEIAVMADAHGARAGDAAQSLAEALEHLQNLSGGWAELAESLRGREWPWLMAVPREPLALRSPAPLPPPCHAVVSSDGSQIAPDRHEVSSCYLLNISRIRLSYGDGERPLMASQPHLYYDEKDLAVEEGGVRLPIEGKYLAIRRMLEETIQLVDLLCETVGPDRPCIGMADGTLIQWPISREAQGYSGQALDTFLRTLDRAMERRAPVVGYISNPGGSSVVATLRAALCPAGYLTGARCPCLKNAAPVQGSPSPSPEDAESPVAPAGAVAGGPRPCELLALTSDSRLFGRLLGPGERSAVFESTSQVLSRYGPHAIYFFYLNVGREIARIELPQWAAEDKTMLDLIHSIVMDQASKGYGYPVVLSEAHQQAVVQASDRSLFYQMVEKAYLKRGLPAEFSLKSISKRQPMV
ncbi:MAG: DNA double-strand break repair nuclease NurA [Armatimonadota bacterium]|nr:DNA double-strand break repair nuclease NurA [Armatimonadota bacterium]